ncbi:hypothetical protein [Pseudocitrobacter cyperus]|uniref:Uncharacterized protein n=1 Tax=Pseudocitrobacter cyperus TaxID=3112843 RepID=A0ABV0HII2_9ENTR
MGREFAFAIWLWPLAIADIMALLLSCCAIKHSRVRMIFLWLLLPQIALVGACSLLFYWLNINESLIFFALISQFVSLSLAIAGRRYFRYLCLPCHLFFIALWGYLEPVNYLTREVVHGWENKQSSSLIDRTERDGTIVLENIHDDAQLKQILTQAVLKPDISDNTLKALIARVDTPFSCCGDSHPFFVAVTHLNSRAVYFFTTLLTGDSLQAKNYRLQVYQHNPLYWMYLYLNGKLKYQRGSGQHDLAAAREISGVLLEIVPELLTEDVYEQIINTRDRETLSFFWQKQQPKMQIHRLQMLALVGDSKALVASITDNPSILEVRDDDIPILSIIIRYDDMKKHSNNITLLDFIVRFADASVVNALINANIIDWQRFILADDDYTPLRLAAIKQEEGDRETLSLVLKDMLKQKIAFSDKNIADAITSGAKPEIFLASGMTKQRLCAALAGAENQGITSSALHDIGPELCCEGKGEGGNKGDSGEVWRFFTGIARCSVH